MLCMEKHFARKTSLEHLTVLTLTYKLSSSLMFHLHVDFTVAISDFCDTISAGILKSTIRKGICRGEEGIKLGKLLT